MTEDLLEQRTREQREKAIKTIISLFPPETSQEGRGLLWQVLCENWQCLNDNMLFRLASLNKALVNKKKDKQERERTIGE